jgi:hypothetical protein
VPRCDSVPQITGIWTESACYIHRHGST